MSGRGGKPVRPGPDQRLIVLQILERIRSDNVYSHVAVREALDAAEGLGRTERAFIKRLTEGIIERRIELDSIIRRYQKSGNRIRPAVMDILRMGLYQILYMDSVPDSAACNEAVRLTKRLGRKEQAGFVNGLLRNVIRDRDAGSGITAGKTERKERQIQQTMQQEGRSPVKKISLRYSMPEWITSMWVRQYGLEKTETILRALLEVRPVSIRLDERLTDEEADEVLRQISQSGVRVMPGSFLPYCRKLERVPDLRSLPGFDRGNWTVQDESSMLVTEAASLTGGETVMDLCAAPGGKAMHAAARLERLYRETGRRGRVLAFDVSEHKAARIRENAARMRLSDIAVGVRDARVLVPGDEGTADVVFCDLPCSGLGTAGRKRDVKYRAAPAVIDSLVLLQRDILRTAVRYLKENGVLIYSTCTIDRRENEDMALFISDELGLTPDPLAPCLPGSIEGIEGNMLQLLPGIHDTDGFFIARFVKKVNGTTGH